MQRFNLRNLVETFFFSFKKICVLVQSEMKRKESLSQIRRSVTLDSNLTTFIPQAVNKVYITLLKKSQKAYFHK